MWWFGEHAADHDPHAHYYRAGDDNRIDNHSATDDDHDGSGD